MAKVIQIEHVRGPVVGPASIPSGQPCTVLDFKPRVQLNRDTGTEVTVWDDNDEHGRGSIDPMVYLIAGYTIFFALLAWLVT